MIADNEIRILDLLPHPGGADEAPIKCEIRVAALADYPKYEALSYVWGDDDRLLEIDVAGRKVGVTRNLYSALQRLRLPDVKRSLWIDQLCINQWDTKEKAVQVRLMRKIYTSCQAGLIWMGEFPAGVSLANAEGALSVLGYMAAAAQSDAPESVPVPACLQTDEACRTSLRALQTLSYDAGRQKGNPWWGRVWTVQEAVLPPQLVLLWGPLSIPWKQVDLAASCWVSDVVPRGVTQFIGKPYAGFMAFLMAMILWLRFAKQGFDNPMHLVNRWRWRRATDPRDSIYALLGLCRPGSLPLSERCDYDLSVVEVFCSLTLDIIMVEGGLLALISDPRLEPELATPGMPRWALDVAVISELNTDWYHLYGYKFYNANARRQLDLEAFHNRWLRDHTTLELTGVYVDVVEQVGECIYRPHGDGGEAAGVYLKGLRNWETLAKEFVTRGQPGSSELYPGHCTFREAFGRLILGDLMRNFNQNPMRKPTQEDIDSVHTFLNTGECHDPDRWTTIWQMIKNQVIFITKTGLMGIGHVETEPGDEVWVFHGGRVPFTVTPKEGSGPDDYDFGGRCYVQGIMQGEVFEWENRPTERVLTIY